MNTKIVFDAIKNFVNDTASVYGEKYPYLSKYQRLLRKTKDVHKMSISKHISAFNEFFSKNHEALIEQNAEKFTLKTISYSKNVYIDISEILRIADSDTRPIIWRHILTIYALTNPSKEIKELLSKEEVKENLENLDLAGPGMPDISKILASLGSGKMDIGQLMGSVMGMVSNLESQTDGDPQAMAMLGMVKTMMGNMAPPSATIEEEVEETSS